MRTADICPTCSTFTNALCVIFDGPFLPILDIEPLDSIDIALNKIEAWASFTKQTKVTLSATQIKNLGATSIDAILAPGAGKVAIIKDLSYRWNWGSVMFDASNIIIKYNGGDTITFSDNIPAADNVNRLKQLERTFTVNILENTKIVISGTDSEVTGDSTLDLYITYEIITL